jgi:Fe-S-cluster containining protein
MQSDLFLCRTHCGACCIAPDISSPLPEMPHGKPAGVPCIHLDKDFRCLLFGKENRPKVCIDFRPEPTICGNSRKEALEIISSLLSSLT